jgi:putative lipoic acid-binding regulatory protein
MKKPTMDKSSSNAPKEALTFPCEFVLKVFGLASAEFETAVVMIVRKHVPHFGENAIQTRPSKDGKYNALSITFTAESREQLDALYRELTSNPQVLMVL